MWVRLIGGGCSLCSAFGSKHYVVSVPEIFLAHLLVILH
jgi:hypothetical protein